MKAINPATEELIHDYPETTDAEMANRMEMVQDAFQTWRRTPFSQRTERMQRLAALLREDLEEYSQLITQEMGKPISQSRAEIEKCALVCDFYADRAETLLAPQPVKTEAAKSFVDYEPLGPILAIMPWNFPFWQVFRFAAPALMAGNVAVLKHAGNVPGTAKAIEELFVRAEFPAEAMCALLIPSAKVSPVIQHPAIRAVTLTGSDRAGAAVAEESGRAIKKTVLELGGSDAFLVLADADPRAAAELATRARTINSGQSCIAAKRFLVEEAIADAFEDALIEEMGGLSVGDPRDDTTDVGPLAREDLLTTLQDQVDRTLDAGAELKLGGRRLDRRGYFYEPTVLSGVQAGMAAFDEETFGPVAPVIRVRDADEAVAMANRSPYGLGACIYTGHPARGEQLARKVEAGCVFVNEMVRSDPRLPFGGVKRSGYGRELSDVGIREFVNIKTIFVK